MDTKTAQRQLISLITQHLSDSIPVTRILTYKPNKNGSVTGRFESLGRVFNFAFNGMDVKYKPAGNMDSDLFSEYYLQRFDAAPRGVRAIPKCTSKSYSCKGAVGVRCLPLTLNCKMGNSEIGNERLNKIKGLAKLLISSSADASKLESARAKIVEQRMALAAENKAKNQPKSLAKTVVETVKVIKPKKEKAAKKKVEMVVKPDVVITSSETQNKETTLAPTIKEPLGEGAFARVYLTNSGTAFKQFKDQKDVSAHFKNIGIKQKDLNPTNTAEREVELAMLSARMGVGAKVLSVAKKDGKIIGYEMELIKGKTTNDISGIGLLSYMERPEGANFLLKVAQLHLNSIAHNDLHTGNVLIESNGAVKIIDAGMMTKGDKGRVIQDAAGLFWSRSENKHTPDTVGHKLFNLMNEAYQSNETIKKQPKAKREELYNQAHDRYLSALKKLLL